MAHKMKAHQKLEDALAAGVDERHWHANQLADRLAERAAMQAQLDGAAVAEVQSHDDEARRVQEHPAAVALQVAKDAPALYWPSSRLQRRADAAMRAREKWEALEEAARNTTHSLCEATGRCTKCLRGPTAAQPRMEFLRTPCTGRPHNIDDSHTMHLTRGL